MASLPVRHHACLRKGDRPTDRREGGSSEADLATFGGHKSEMGKLVILPKIRDPRFITVRRGGSLQDDDHRLLAVWAAACAEHVLHHFEQARPKDDRPRRAIDLGRAWARGEITWWEARTAAGHAQAAARELSGAARHAAFAAGQAAAVGHVAAHELGAAAYAIKAERAAAAEDEREAAGRLECQWQRAQLPPRDPRTCARRPAAAQRVVLVCVRLLTGTASWEGSRRMPNTY